MAGNNLRDGRPLPRGGATAALLAAALLLSSCSSSGSSSSGSTTTGTIAVKGESSSAAAAVPAGLTTAAEAGLSTAAEAGLSTAAAAGLATATANVARYSAKPTALTVTQPLPAAPATGKSVVFLQCEVQQCTDGGDGFRAAAAAVGWKVTTLNWKSTDPSTLVADLQQALTLNPKPYAVSLSGLPEPIWESQVAAYAQANVLMIPWSLGPVTTSTTVIANILAPEDIMLQGKLLADWFITDSRGKGKVLLQNVPQYPSMSEESAGFQNEVAASCPGCKLTGLDVTGTQIASNGVTSAIVSALQRDPSIGYVASSDIALAPGLPAALKAANLTGVKIVGGAASPTDEQNVRDGTVSAVMKNDLVYCGWLMMDALLRHAAGLTFAPNDGGVPQQILTRSTIAPAGASELVPAGYPDLFKKLWKVA